MKKYFEKVTKTWAEAKGEFERRGFSTNQYGIRPITIPIGLEACVLSKVELSGLIARIQERFPFTKIETSWFQEELLSDERETFEFPAFSTKVILSSGRKKSPSGYFFRMIFPTGKEVTVEEDLMCLLWNALHMLPDYHGVEYELCNLEIKFRTAGESNVQNEIILDEDLRREQWAGPTVEMLKSFIGFGIALRDDAELRRYLQVGTYLKFS